MIKIFILVLLILISLIIYLIILKRKKMNNITMNKVYIIQEQLEPLYKKVKLRKLFKKYPKKVKNLTFGFICPGAMRTIEYLNKEVSKKENKKYRDLVYQVSTLTDLQFFIEIFVIYKDYIDKDAYEEIKFILKRNSCTLSKLITAEITDLFGNLSKEIRENLPDDFYHIRHNTLICSKDKELATQRIDLLKSIYGSVESFNNKHKLTSCIGKRDGTSGCRKCCNKHFAYNYQSCVKQCMDF